MVLMFCIPNTDKGTDELEATYIAIRKMNDMFRSLINKIQNVRIIPWITPKIIQIGGRYMCGYNIFISPSNKVYNRINVFYSFSISITEVDSIILPFKKPRV